MASLKSLAEFGFGVMFGLDPTPPATFSVPAGPSVSVGEGQSQKWQHDAWRIWRDCWAVHYPSNRLSRQASLLEWRVRVRGQELKPQSAKDEINRVTAGMGPQKATYLLSLNDMVAGEAWYVEHEPDRFAVWSVLEQDFNTKLKAVQNAGRINVRMWQPDPTAPNKADSSVRTAIGPADEMMTLTALSESQSRHRLSQAGVVITPSEQLYAAEDPWEQNLVDAMSRAIKDVRSPAALAPIVIRMRRDLIETVRYLTFPRPYDDLIDRKQERAIRSIAGALDIEPELLTGAGEMTYWNAWAVSMDTYQAHVAPRADRIGAVYAEVAEKLRARRGDTSPVEVDPDPRVMLARRSTVRDAMDGYKLGVVNGRYVRDAMGATEQDAPSDEEREQMAAFNGGTMDRERRVGENPGPARSDPNNAQTFTDLEVAEHARKTLGFKLRDAWRHTPHRNKVAPPLLPSDYTCHVPFDDIDREFSLDGGVVGVIRVAVAEVADESECERLVSWVVDNLTQPTASLRAREEVSA